MASMQPATIALHYLQNKKLMLQVVYRMQMRQFHLSSDSVNFRLIISISKIINIFTDFDTDYSIEI